MDLTITHGHAAITVTHYGTTCGTGRWWCNFMIKGVSRPLDEGFASIEAGRILSSTRDVSERSKYTCTRGIDGSWTLSTPFPPTFKQLADFLSACLAECL